MGREVDSNLSVKPQDYGDQRRNGRPKGSFILQQKSAKSPRWLAMNDARARRNNRAIEIKQNITLCVRRKGQREVQPKAKKTLQDESSLNFTSLL